MKVSYWVRPKADRDLDEIADYLVEDAGLDTGLHFLGAAYETFSLIAQFPEMGWHCRLQHPRLASARVFRIPEFDRILIFYLAYEDRIEILRVLHGAQDLMKRFAEEGVE